MTDCSQISCVPAPFHPASPLLDGRELDGNTFTGYFPPELLPLLGLGEPDLPSFKVQVMFSSRRRQLWAGGGSDISLGVKWGSYFIITDYFLKLGVENTTHAWQVGWWESERWLRLLLVRGGGGARPLSAPAVPVPSHAHAASSPRSWSSAIYSASSSWCIYTSQFYSCCLAHAEDWGDT